MEAWTQFTVAGTPVHGIVHRPDRDAAANGGGIVFLHGWSGCKLGPHRMFVKTARALAAEGFTCLRIDFRGRGDSPPSSAEASIRSMTEDACAAAKHLRTFAGIHAVALLGICSGGKVAVTAATRRGDIDRLVLWSAEGLAPLRGTQGRRRRRHHVLREYAAKALRPRTWLKLVTGRTRLDLVRKAVRQDEAPSDRECREETATLTAFASYRGEVLFIYGGNDPETQSSAAAYRDFCATHGIPHRFHEIPEANHSFYSLEWEQRVIDLTREWLQAPRTPGADRQSETAS